MRLLSIGLVEGVHPVRGRVAWQAWTTERLLDSARTMLFPLYSSLFTPIWLRMLGAEVGRDVEASTVLLIPSLTTIDDGAFLADDTMVATYELKGGWMHLGTRPHRQACVPRQLRHGGRRPSGAARRPGRGALGGPREVEAGVVVARLTRRAAAPCRQRRRPRAHLSARGAGCASPGRSGRLCRVIPVFVTCAIALAVLFCLAWLIETWDLAVAILASGVVLLLAGAVAAAITTIAKWLLRRPDPRGRASALVELRVAHGGLRHVHRDGRRALVRERGRRHPRARDVAALARREGRARGVDRQLLAARAGSRHARRRGDRQSRMCGSDASVP